jgi:uncharacterized protein (TIGR02265 family)
MSHEGKEQTRDSVAELVRDVCDLEERLPLVPASAQVRGLYFQSTHQEVVRAARYPEFSELLKLRAGYQAKALQWYPVSEYLRWLAAAAYLIRGKANFQQGLFDLGYADATAFVNTILGRAVLRVLSHDPARVALQGVSARKHSVTYGKWTCQRHGEREMSMVYEREYLWIESAIAGAAKGTFDACDVKIEITTSVSGKFAGETRVKW